MIPTACDDMPNETDRPGWTTALGKVPSGLFIVTANSTEGETGFLASWIQQCSFDPPLISIAINKARPISLNLKPGDDLTVNVIPEGGKTLVAHFGKGFAPGEPAFRNIDHSGHPPRLHDALAWLAVRVVRRHDTGDHTLVIAQVVDGAIQHDGKPTVHIRRDGTRY
jgi:flavin reductase (DIM6/NTAB) family NADH-FMN oxidoreductase RutF